MKHFKVVKNNKSFIVKQTIPTVFVEGGVISGPFRFKWHAQLMCFLFNLMY